MKQQTAYKCPFDIYREDAEFIDNTPTLTQGVKNYLRRVCSLSCPPIQWNHITTAVSIIGKMKLEDDTSLQHDEVEIMDGFLQKKSCHSALSYGAQEYPTFAALDKMNKKKWLNSEVKCCVIQLYISMFRLASLNNNFLDPVIFYHDAYSCRDVFLKHLDDFTLSADDFSSLHDFKVVMIEQCPNIITHCKSSDSTKYNKLKRFLEILTRERYPGQRQKKKSSRRSVNRKGVVDIESIPPSPSAAHDGGGYDVSYPVDDNLEDPICYTRKAPVGGSRISFIDDKFSIQGRANSQAARNVGSIADVNRLPLPCLAAFFNHLVYDNMCLFAYNWMLVTTGIQPSRLAELKITSAKRSKNYKGCHLDVVTGFLTYEIINRPDNKRNQIMTISISDEIIRILVCTDDEYPFFARKEEIAKNVKKFSLHHSGQSPTPERVSASCTLHFTSEHFSEIGTAYLTGHIPARMRAQAHYYSVDIADINYQYRASNEKFINSLKCLEFVGPIMRGILDNLRSFPSYIPEGYVGSINNFPISRMQAVLDQFHIKFKYYKKTFFGSYANEQIHTLSKVLQIQHIQLFIVEQLAFCARKFGNKTSYSMSESMMKLWGSEKASAVASVERKYIPATSLLLEQLDICKDDLNMLDKLAAKYHYKFESSFDLRTDPLPVIFSINDDKRIIKLDRMNSEGFYSILKDLNITDMPKPSSSRVNVFKHIMANALLNKVPQILLDEFMTHDRDGLDFCSAWATGSATSMSILNAEIETVLAELNFYPIRLGESDV